jgi:hypothetical protein
MTCNSASNVNKCVETTAISYQVVVDKLALVAEKAPLDIYNYRKGIEFPKALPGDSIFQNISQNICLHKAGLIQVLQDSARSYPEKEIALYALHHLCIEDYVDILQITFEEYKVGKLDEKFLQDAIISHRFISIEVIKNYNHKKLVKVLTEIKGLLLKNKLINEIIDDILSGERWLSIWHHYNDLGWYCGKELQ